MRKKSIGNSLLNVNLDTCKNHTEKITHHTVLITLKCKCRLTEFLKTFFAQNCHLKAAPYRKQKSWLHLWMCLSAWVSDWFLMAALSFELPSRQVNMQPSRSPGKISIQTTAMRWEFLFNILNKLEQHFSACFLSAQALQIKSL